MLRKRVLALVAEKMAVSERFLMFLCFLCFYEYEYENEGLVKGYLALKQMPKLAFFGG